MKKLLSASAVSIIMIAIGICLLINPEKFMSWLFYIVGAAAIIFAIIKFLFAYKNGTVKLEAFNCICLLIAGTALCILQAKVLGIIPLIIGICFLVFGAAKLHGAFAFKNVDDIIFKKLAISASISIILAIVIICCSGIATDIILRIIGAILMYNAAENIFSCVISKDEPVQGIIPVESEETEE